MLLLFVFIASLVCDVSYGNHSSHLRNTNEIKEGLESFTADIVSRMVKDSDANKNLVVSPMSIFTALAMVGKGAKSETYQEIKDAMHLPKIVSYPMVLFSRQTFKSKSLSFAQRVFLDLNATIEADYQNLLYFFGYPSAKRLDFQNQPESATKIINSWVSENTNEKIKNLIPKGVINTMTKLVIANALALKVSWTKKFDEPKLGRFEVSPNNFNKVMMMTSSRCSCKSTSFRGVTNLMTSAEVVTMPFEDESLIFAMAIPNTAGDFSEFDDQSGYRKMFDTVERMHPSDEQYSNKPYSDSFEMCVVKMPKFDIEFDYKNLQDHLKSMGINKAFDGQQADFSGIMKEPVYVSDVFHKSTFNLNRNGVEASAATAFLFMQRSFYNGETVNVNKPFVFFVKNVETGAILFIGKVVNP